MGGNSGNMRTRDFYQVLGIGKDASEDEIRKAYKKKAVKCHPDKVAEKERTAAEEEFKLLAEAYSVLSDSEKRKLYDMYGEDGLRGGGGGSPPAGSGGFQPGAGGGGYTYQGDPNELFASLFGGQFGGQFGSGASQGFGSVKRGGAQAFNMEDLLQGMHGANESPQSRQNMFFSSPHGVNSGKKRVQHNLPVSLEDLYTGCSKKMKVHRRSTTSNRTPERVLKVDIQQGWKEGTAVTFNNEGNEISEGVFEDISFIIKEKAHPHFKREGDNLIFEATIPLIDALTGCKIDVPHLNGKIMRVNVKDVVQPDYQKTVAGLGMPKKNSRGQHGDLVIKFNVTYPTHISDDQKQLLRNALPGQL